MRNVQFGNGYCVGLFESHDVPDEYWCESCKPEFHILVNNDGYSKRTLYKPVNDKRKKLEQMTFKTMKQVIVQGEEEVK